MSTPHITLYEDLGRTVSREAVEELVASGRFVCALQRVGKRTPITKMRYFVQAKSGSSPFFEGDVNDDEILCVTTAGVEEVHPKPMIDGSLLDFDDFLEPASIIYDSPGNEERTQKLEENASLHERISKIEQILFAKESISSIEQLSDVVLDLKLSKSAKKKAKKLKAKIETSSS
jgi:hypothetical protein